MRFVKKFFRKIPFYQKIVFTILIVDVIFIVLHFLIGQRIYLFHLDFEKNIPTLFQGFKLIFLSSLIFSWILILFIKKRKILWLFFPAMIFFMFLALDEVGQLHEEVYSISIHLFESKTSSFLGFFTSFGYHSSYWVLLYLPLIFLAFFYFIFLLFYFYKNKIDSRILLLSLFCLGSVILLEVLGTTDKNFNQNTYNFIMPMEELMEMVGVTLFIGFIMINLRKEIIKIEKQ